MDFVSSNQVAKPVGPYSQAIISKGLFFCSGQLPIDKKGNVIKGGIEKQTRQVFENMNMILNGGGLYMDKVVKVTVYLVNEADFVKFNKVYGEYFTTKPMPARSTVFVKSLPKGVKVEIDCIAEV